MPAAKSEQFNEKITENLLVMEYKSVTLINLLPSHGKARIYYLGLNLLHISLQGGSRRMCQVRRRRCVLLVVPTVSLHTTMERLRSDVMGRGEVKKMLREGQRFMARGRDENEVKNKDELRRKEETTRR